MFLSIVIPVYNASQTIERCLNSIWIQGLPEDNFEVICVDDGSQDNSLEIMEKISRIHTELHVIRNNENLRAGGARNHGVREAKGDYILFIDSDDYFHPGSLLDVFNYQKERLLDILVCDFARHTENNPNNTLVHKFKSQKVMTGRQFLVVNSLPYAPWKYIFKRELMMSNNLWFAENVSCEDVDWSHKIAFYAKTMQYHPILLTHYILVPTSQTGSSHKKQSTVFHWLMAGKRVAELTALCKTTEEHNCIMRVANETMWNGLIFLCALSTHPLKKSAIIKQCINPALSWPPKIAFIYCHSLMYGVISTLVSPLFKLALSLKRTLLGR